MEKGIERMNWTSLFGIALWALLPGFIAKNRGRSFWGYYFLSFLITPLLTTIITVCLSNCSQSKEKWPGEPASTAAVEPQIAHKIDETSDDSKPIDVLRQLPVTESAPTLQKIRFCRRCGFELIDESKFCSRCGNEIERVDNQ